MFLPPCGQHFFVLFRIFLETSWPPPVRLPADRRLCCSAPQQHPRGQIDLLLSSQRRRGYSTGVHLLTSKASSFRLQSFQALLTDKTVQLKTVLMEWFVFDPNDALLGELISAIQDVLNIRLPSPHFNQYCFPFRSFAVELAINRRGTGIALPRPPRLSLQMDVKRG